MRKYSYFAPIRGQYRIKPWLKINVYISSLPISNYFMTVIIDKIFISNQIKLEILKICGQPTTKAYNLPGRVDLGTLNLEGHDKFYRLLEYKLQEIASNYNTGKIIIEGDITEDTTVNKCIRLVCA